MELFTGDSGIHRFVPEVIVTGREKLFAEIVNGSVVFAKPMDASHLFERDAQSEVTCGSHDSLERCRILRNPVHRACFTSHTFHKHPNGHTTGKGVRIDDNVRLHPTLAEWHIDGWPFLGTDTFLTMPRGKLITDYW